MVSTLVGCWLGLFAAVDTQKLPRTFQPVATWTVSVGKGVKPDRARCDSRQQLERFLAKIGVSDDERAGWDPPEVDYEKYSVVVTCWRPREGAYYVEECVEAGDYVRVRYLYPSMQTGLIADGDLSEADRAAREAAKRRREHREQHLRLSFAIVPAGGKVIIIEFGERQDTAHPYTWREDERFAPNRDREPR